MENTTSAKSWKEKARATKTLTLAGGNKITVKRVSKTALLRNGHLPDKLMGAAIGAHGGVNVGLMKADEARAWVEFLALYISFAAVDPKVILKGDPKEGEISIDDLTDEEQFQIFQEVEKAQFGQGEPSASLKTFPEGAGSPPDRPPGEALSAAPGSPAGDSGSVGSA